MTTALVRDPHADEGRATLQQRARWLAGASVAYNVVEAAVAVVAGAAAGSTALVGFGLDSVVEVSSGLVILWQFRHPLPETRERVALRLMALCFLALAVYVAVGSVHALATSGAADRAPVGIVLAAVSLVVMPLLSRAQRRTGRALGSDAVVADSTQTLLCTWMSAALLFGLLLNATLGWVLGRPGRRPGDRCDRAAGGPLRLAGRGLLRHTARVLPVRRTRPVRVRGPLLRVTVGCACWQLSLTLNHSSYKRRAPVLGPRRSSGKDGLTGGNANANSGRCWPVATGLGRRSRRSRLSSSYITRLSERS